MFSTQYRATAWTRLSKYLGNLKHKKTTSTERKVPLRRLTDSGPSVYVGEMNELKWVMGIAVKWEHSNMSWKWKMKKIYIYIYIDQQGQEFAMILFWNCIRNHHYERCKEKNVSFTDKKIRQQLLVAVFNGLRSEERRSADDFKIWQTSCKLTNSN